MKRLTLVALMLALTASVSFAQKKPRQPVGESTVVAPTAPQPPAATPDPEKSPAAPATPEAAPTSARQTPPASVRVPSAQDNAEALLEQKLTVSGREVTVAQLLANHTANPAPVPWDLVILLLVVLVTCMATLWITSFIRKRLDELHDRLTELFTLARGPETPRADLPIDVTRRITPRRPDISLIVLAIALGSAANAFAQAPTPPAPTVSAIASVRPATLYKEQDKPVSITITAAKGTDFSTVEKINLGSGFTITDVVATPTRVTAKVAADDTVPVGLLAPVLIRKDGTKIETDNVFVKVLSWESGVVRGEVMGNVSALRSELKKSDEVVFSQVIRQKKDLEDIRTVNHAEYEALKREVSEMKRLAVTSEFVNATFQTQVGHFRDEVRGLVNGLNALSARVQTVEANDRALRDAVVTLSETSVPSGRIFGGKKPLNPELAQRLRASIVIAGESIKKEDK